MSKIQFLFFLLAIIFCPCHGVQAQSLKSGETIVSKIVPSSATASSSDPSKAIENSFDGNLNSFYQSNLSNIGALVWLEYNFSKPFDFSSFTYHPRKDGSTEGNFKELELWISTTNYPKYRKVASYNFNGSSTASTVQLSTIIEGVKSAYFIVRSGVGAGKGSASCSEMEFYGVKSKDVEPDPEPEPTPTPKLEGVKISVANATASSFQAGTPIENSFDGKSNTFYHSSWTNSASNYMPITLNYNFSKSFDFEGFIYYPRQDGGTNGNFKEFEVWISTTNNPNYVKIGDYNFNGVSTASTVQLSTIVKGVKSVRFIVKSGVGTGQGFASCSEMEFYESTANDVDPSPTPTVDGVKVPVSSAKASSYQVGTPIENSFDNNSDTFYHSNWTNSASNYMPITLDYNLSKTINLSGFIYYPRQDVGTNGNFKEFEVWILLAGGSAYTKAGDYNFKGSSTVSAVQFSTPIKGVKSVRFIVKSGVGAGQGFASCSEMEFYESTANDVDPSPTPTLDGMLINVSSAKASSVQANTPIENSFDGKTNTFYHSNWSNTTSTYFPINLDYNFSKAFDFTGFIYYPRQDGSSNGHFKEFEVWVKTGNNSNYNKIGDYNFAGRATASTVKLSSAVKDVESVRFIVKSGSGDGQGFVSCSEMEFYGQQPITGKIENDIKVQVKRGEASSFQSSTPIENSFDGNFNTLYHSNWNNKGTNYFPITLSYYFDNTPNIDYLIYYTRQDGSFNGHFKEFEVWVSTSSNPTYTKIDSYNLGGRAGAHVIEFPSTIRGVTSIRLIVKSGSGEGQGFASCSEIEFYERNPNQFDYSLIFTDASCSELKKGVTEREINQIEDSFLKKLAMDIYLGTYNTEFRIQSYKPYQYPDIMKAQNKTSGSYSLRDNPTGISVNKDDEIVVFMDKTSSKGINIVVQNLEKGFDLTSFPLLEGANKIKMPTNGLLYIMYNTLEATESPVKINIVGGKVNGYFDSQKHVSSDWTRLINVAVDKHFDVLGKYAHLTFPTEDLRKNTNDGKALIDIYDQIVLLEQDFMGLVKYDKMFNNRLDYVTTYNEGAYMYASSNHTAYAPGTMSFLTNPQKLKSSDNIWGPAHETGHTNQTTGLKWTGMGEVTNNIHSMYVRSELAGTSRLEDANSNYKNTYEKGFNTFIVTKSPHNYPGGGTSYPGNDGDLFCRLIPFWQLKLYFHDVKGNNDFYKDVYEYLRTHTDIKEPGLQQLNFVKIVCEVGQEDMTEFFESWGFLTPIDLDIDDYGVAKFQVTQAQIDLVKSEIAAMNLAKPKLNVKYLTDNLIQTYKNNQSIVVNSSRVSGNTLTVDAKNVVTYEVYDADVLKSIYIKNQFSLGSNGVSSTKVYAVSASGQKVQVYPTIAKSTLRSIGSEETENDVNYKVNVVDRRITLEPNVSFDIYSINGLRMSPKSQLLPGIYVVTIDNKSSVKVVVK